MEDKQLDAEQSLRIIEKMIADSRNKFYNNGFAFIFWGFLVILSFLAVYLLIQWGYNDAAQWVWPVMTVFGVIITFAYYRVFSACKDKRQGTTSDVNNGRIWLGFLFSIIVLIYLCIYLQINPGSFIWCLMGFGMFACGAIYRYKPIYLGAIVFWIGAVISVRLQTNGAVVITGILTMLLGYIVPGVLLWLKVKKESNV